MGAYDERGSLFFSSDGGKIWQKTQYEGEHRINQLFFLNSRFGWLVGDNGFFMHTSDGGETWIRLETGIITDLCAVQFISPDLGIICGNNGIVITAERQK